MGQITPAVAKFDFQGQLLENGKQVITDVYKNINITIPGVTATASGQLEIITTPALDSESTEASFHAKHLKMTLTLPPGPEGPQGDIGPTPRITAVAQGGTTASVSAVHLSNDPNYDYQLKFVLPQGPQGLKAPAIIPKVHTKTAGVVDITVTSTGSGNNKTEF